MSDLQRLIEDHQRRSEQEPLTRGEFNRFQLAHSTLRDQFAMAALTGLLAGSAVARRRSDVRSVAQTVYLMADAMMAAREVKL